MEKCSCAWQLCVRGESPWFVFCAYFFALLPLAIVYVLDFITEKWKTIRATRREGYWHFFITLVCLPFLLYFIHLQRCIGNYTEMGATITAVLLSVFHMARTVWGLIQLQAFKRWNVDALYALTRIGYPAPANGRTRLSREECSRTIENLMVVNSTLIDNAFFGTELPIRLDITSGRLYATRPEECAVRWLVAFLSQFGSKWLAQRPLFDDCAFTSSVFHGIRATLHVTRLEDGQLVTPLPLNHPFVSDRSVYGMYKSPYIVDEHSSLPLYFELKSRLEFRLYETTIQEAVLAWDKRSVFQLPEDERLAVAKIKPEHISCFVRIMDCATLGGVLFEDLGVESSKQICRFEKRFQLEDARLKRFILQLGFPSATPADIEKFVGVLPIRKNILAQALWRDDPSAMPSIRRMRNKFLQASLHLDNYIALLHVDLQQEFGTSLDDCSMKSCFLGCVLETVRSVLQSSPDNSVNWTPPIESGKKICSLPISFQLQEGILEQAQEDIAGRKVTNLLDVYIRLLGEMQAGVLDRIATAEHQGVSDLAAMPETMVLMVLGFPALRISCADELDVRTNGTDTSLFAQDTVLNIVPQHGGQRDLFLRFRADLASGRADLEIVGESSFDWYLWKCAALKSMHRLWTVTEQKRPHLEVSDIVGDASVRSVMPWPPFFDVELDFEEGKLPDRRPVHPFNSGGRRKRRAPAARARAKAWRKMLWSSTSRAAAAREYSSEKASSASGIRAALARANATSL